LSLYSLYYLISTSSSQIPFETKKEPYVWRLTRESVARQCEKARGWRNKKEWLQKNDMRCKKHERKKWKNYERTWVSMMISFKSTSSRKA